MVKKSRIVYSEDKPFLFGKCRERVLESADTMQDIKGIRIRTINAILMAVVSAAFLALFFVTYRSFNGYQKLENSTGQYTKSQMAASEMKAATDYLTEQARLFALRGELQYVQAYFKEKNETKRCENSLIFFEELGIDETVAQELRQAMELSQDLTDVECHAMRLAATGFGVDDERLPEEVRRVTLSEYERNMTKEQQIQRALDLVVNDEYVWRKSSVYYHIDEMISRELLLLEHHMKKDSDKLYRSLQYLCALLAGVFITNLFRYELIRKLVVHPLDVYIQRIRESRRMEVRGAYELKYLASTYNHFYEHNAQRKAMLEYRAEHDTLSGVLNRTAFDALTKSLSGQSLSIALLVIDIDDFKSVNDTYGHETGDLVIKKVAHILEKVVRANDRVARYGGDEFVVIMMIEGSESGKNVIDRKVARINRMLANGENGLPVVTVSVGVAFSKEGYHEKLFAQADEALYNAKKAGKQCCRFYREKSE